MSDLVTCPDGSTCFEAGSICLERHSRPGEYYCDCDYDEGQQKFFGLECSHKFNFDCKKEDPDNADPDGPPIHCFNYGVCSVEWEDDKARQICECEDGFSGDFCQFVGNPDHPEENRVVCPDGTTCEHGSMCYQNDNHPDKFYCDCDHAGRNEELGLDFTKLECFHDDAEECPGSAPGGGGDAFCYNKGKCKSKGGQNYCHCPKDVFGHNCQFLAMEADAEVAAAQAANEGGGKSGGVSAAAIVIPLFLIIGLGVFCMFKRGSSRNKNSPEDFTAMVRGGGLS